MPQTLQVDLEIGSAGDPQCSPPTASPTASTTKSDQPHRRARRRAALQPGLSICRAQSRKHADRRFRRILRQGVDRQTGALKNTAGRRLDRALERLGRRHGEPGSAVLSVQRHFDQRRRSVRTSPARDAHQKAAPAAVDPTRSSSRIGAPGTPAFLARAERRGAAHQVARMPLRCFAGAGLHALTPICRARFLWRLSCPHASARSAAPLDRPHHQRLHHGGAGTPMDCAPRPAPPC